MRKSWIIRLTAVILLLLPAEFIFAQKVKITKILDSNLFGLEDGRIIKMAGIDAPRKNNPGSHLSEVAEGIISYAEKTLLDSHFDIIQISDSLGDAPYSLVYITKSYPFGSTDINKQFLESGFGRFNGNVDSLHMEEFIKAEKAAIKHHNGLWAIRPVEIKDTLDRDIASQEMEHYKELDSVYYAQVRWARRTPFVGRVMSETFTGATCGVIGVLPGMMTGFMIDISIPEGDSHRWRGLLGAVIGAYTGYVTGSSLGVYIIAKDNNPDASFLGTFASGLAGAAAGIGIISLHDYNDVSFFFDLILPPLVGSVIYANIADFYYVKKMDSYGKMDSLRENFNSYGSTAFKDYRNKDILFNIPLIHIPLGITSELK